MSDRAIPPSVDTALTAYLRDLSDRVSRLENGGAIKGQVSFDPTIRVGGVAIETATDGSTIAFRDASTGATITPSGSLPGYASIDTPVAVSSTSESAGTPIIDGAVFQCDGSPVLVQFFAPYLEVDQDADQTLAIVLFDQTADLGVIAELRADVNALAGEKLHAPGIGWLRYTPTAGSHTYSVTGFKSGSNAASPVVGAGGGGAGQYVNAYLRVTRDT